MSVEAEYAALTTSLALSNGLPARFILGIVLVEKGKDVGAFGHAWTEVWLEDKWEILDAAIYGVQETNLHYIPLSELENEGFGYTLSFLEGVSRLPNCISDVRSIKPQPQ